MILFDSCKRPLVDSSSPGLCSSCQRQPPIQAPSASLSREFSPSRGLFTSPEQSVIYGSPAGSCPSPDFDPVDKIFREALPSLGLSVSTVQLVSPERSEKQQRTVHTWQSTTTERSERQSPPGSDAALGADSDSVGDGPIPDLALVYSLLHSVSYLHLKDFDPVGSRGSSVSRPLPIDQVASRESRESRAPQVLSRGNSRSLPLPVPGSTQSSLRGSPEQHSHRARSREHSRTVSRENSRVHFDSPGLLREGSRVEAVLAAEVKRLEGTELAASRLLQQNRELQRRVQELEGANQDLREHLADATFPV